MGHSKDQPSEGLYLQGLCSCSSNTPFSNCMSHRSRTVAMLQWSFVRSHLNSPSTRVVTAQSRWQEKAPWGQRQEDSWASAWRVPYREGLKATRQPQNAPSFVPGSEEPHPEPERGETNGTPATPPAEGPSPDLHTWAACSLALRSYREGTPSHDPVLVSSYLEASGQLHFCNCITCVPLSCPVPFPHVPCCPLSQLDYNPSKTDDQTPVPYGLVWHKVKCSLNVLELWFKYNHFFNRDKWAKLRNCKL